MNDIQLRRPPRPGVFFFIFALLSLLISACGGNTGQQTMPEGDATTGILTLPEVTELATDDAPLRVLATTSIIGDIVSRVGGDAIDLVVLMPPGQDPHSFQPGAADLTAAADADLIFVNGWNLEEGLAKDISSIGRRAVIIPVSAGIVPRTLGDEEHDGEASDGEAHGHGAVDPHVWQDVANVMQWVENIRRVLGAADPANAAVYDANAARYLGELEQLDADLRTTLSNIPSEKRVLITNHDNLGYFAEAYDFEIAGAIIPSISTLAEPTAGAMAALVNTMKEHGICTVVTETTSSGQLARTLQNELTFCEEVTILPISTDALGPGGSETASYTGLMRANAAALVEGLR